MFAGIPSWERNRKRRSFGGGKSRPAAPTVAAEPVTPRNAAYMEPTDTAFAAEPVFATSTVKKSGGGVAPLAIAAGIVAIGGLAAAGWYASQPHETGMAQLTPGTESVAPPAATMPQVASNLAPMPGESATAPTAAPTPARTETPAPRATTRVAAAAPARARPAQSASAEDAGVNTSATLPAAPQPYSGTAVAPSAPADVAPVSPPVEAAPQPVNPAPAPVEAAPQVTPPAAATPPVQTPPST
jgi:hypothetical protein